MDSSEDIILEAVRTHGISSPILDGGLITGDWNGKKAAVFVYKGEGDRENLFLFLDNQIPFRAIAIMSPVEEGVLMACEREGIIIWDRAMVEALVGRHTLLSKAGVKLREPLFPPVEERTFEVFSSDLNIRGEQSIVPKVSRAEVEHKGSRVGGFKFQLLLVPHYLFKYRCKLQSTSGTEKEVQGLMWVDAVDGTCRSMPHSFKSVDDIEQAHFKQEPDITLAESSDIVLQGIVDLNTRESEEVRHTGSATIFEKQRTYPVQESIETEHLGILFVPIWSIEGSRGTMLVNGITAEVVREEAYQ